MPTRAHQGSPRHERNTRLQSHWILRREEPTHVQKCRRDERTEDNGAPGLWCIDDTRNDVSLPSLDLDWQRDQRKENKMLSPLPGCTLKKSNVDALPLNLPPPRFHSDEFLTTDRLVHKHLVDTGDDTCYAYLVRRGLGHISIRIDPNCERSIGTVFQLPSPDAITVEMRRKRGR